MSYLTFIGYPNLDLSVCKLRNFVWNHETSITPVSPKFWSLSYLPGEVSLVCETAVVPEHLCINREDHWKVFKVEGLLDFSLVGILAQITEVLKNSDISLYCLSSYETDWILVKDQDLNSAIEALKGSGHTFKTLEA